MNQEMKNLRQLLDNCIQRLTFDSDKPTYVKCMAPGEDNIELMSKPLREAQDRYKIAYRMERDEKQRIELVTHAEFVSGNGTTGVRLDGDRGTVKLFESCELLDYFNQHDIVNIDEMVGKPYPKLDKKEDGNEQESNGASTPRQESTQRNDDTSVS